MTSEKYIELDEFIALARSSHSDWKSLSDPNVCSWVFRGQKKCGADGQIWKLLPSAWRLDVMQPFMDNIKDRVSPDGFKLGTVEHNLQLFNTVQYLLLRNYGELSLSIGLDEGSGLTRYFENYSENMLIPRNANRDLYLHATNIENAQHYGIPTMLLDWSYSAEISIFHALGDHPVQNEVEKDIVLWCLNVSNRVDSWAGGVGVTSPVKKTNPFLVAQRGLFSRIGSEYSDEYFLKNGHWPSLEDWLARDDWPSDKIRPELRKFVLKGTDASAARAILRRGGISSAHLKPSSENVAKVVMGDLRN